MPFCFYETILLASICSQRCVVDGHCVDDTVSECKSMLQAGTRLLAPVERRIANDHHNRERSSACMINDLLSFGSMAPSYVFSKRDIVFLGKNGRPCI